MLSATRAAARRKLAPDLEALLQAETIAVQAGPRPFEDDTVLAAVREALLSLRALRFRYEGGATPGRGEVTLLGVLFGLVRTIWWQTKGRAWPHPTGALIG